MSVNLRHLLSERWMKTRVVWKKHSVHRTEIRKTPDTKFKYFIFVSNIYLYLQFKTSCIILGYITYTDTHVKQLKHWLINYQHRSASHASQSRSTGSAQHTIAVETAEANEVFTPVIVLLTSCHLHYKNRADCW